MSRSYLFAPIAVLFAVCYAAAAPGEYLKKPDAWFTGDEARQVAANILSYQTDLGGWPKNMATTASPYEGDRSSLQPTYDNGATTEELRYLARIYTATKDAEYSAAFDRGLDYVLQGQYPNGGWPQSHPPGEKYHRHITFNDNAMVHLLEFLREVVESDTYAFVDDARRTSAATAFDRGIDVILRCQIEVDGQLTVWCSQHDEIDLSPRSARSYELATLSGADSVGITHMLMSLDDPAPEVVRAVEAAVAWFEAVKLPGIRIAVVKDEKAPRGLDKVVVEDPTASPLWARFYMIEDNRPVFVDRDGVAKLALADISYERRTGYSWYGKWPKNLLKVDYPEWRRRVAAEGDR